MMTDEELLLQSLLIGEQRGEHNEPRPSSQNPIKDGDITKALADGEGMRDGKTFTPAQQKDGLQAMRQMANNSIIPGRCQFQALIPTEEEPQRHAGGNLDARPMQNLRLGRELGVKPWPYQNLGASMDDRMQKSPYGLIPICMHLDASGSGEMSSQEGEFVTLGDVQSKYNQQRPLKDLGQSSKPSVSKTAQ